MQLRENRKKDAKALFFIQSALEDDIFPRISAANTAYEAWEILKQEYLGDQKVIKVRLQTFRRSFAELMMGEKETVQNYLSRVTEIVSQMCSYGETISIEQVLGKVLRSLNESFDYLVPAIEESKDLSTYTFDELMSSLLAHETRVRKPCDKVEEKAFQVKGESSYREKIENSGGRYGRGGFRGRGRSNGRGRGRHDNGRQNKSLFKDLDEKQNGEVRLGDDKQVSIEGRGTVAIKTIQGHTIALIKMTQKRMFPLDVSNDIGSALVAKNDTETKLWHFRYGHLNVNSLRTPFEAWRGKKPRVTVSMDVKFNEEERWMWNTDEKQPGAFIEFPHPRHEEPEENGSSDSSSSDSTPPDSPTQNSSNHTSPQNSASSSSIGNSLASSNALSPASNLPSGSSSDGTPGEHFRSLRNIYRTCNFALHVADPISFDEAVEHQIWQEAMEAELGQLVEKPADKNLIGLKWVFRTKIDSFFQASGFTRSDNEPTLYFKKQDLGLLCFFLGLDVKQSKDGIFVCQEKHATDLLRKFHMSNCEIAATPMNVNEKLQRVDGTEHADGTIYRSLVGGLNYLTHTRPDIACPVSVVSRYMHNPTKQHLGAARRILRYVAGCLDDRKSTPGNIFSLSSGAVTWSSKKQDTIALSSSEAEYAAATSAARQALWLQKLFTDFPLDHNDATVIYCDNMSAIAMAKKPSFSWQNKTRRCAAPLHTQAGCRWKDSTEVLWYK
ncbi:hypothetical protein SASPL_154366 [Salvia splendens]|uniref:Retrovirus-related Pol polyprotein from transposon TNT 1-94-like beta-barrel domain-containing protein n=1 Tax=Salvia splendens TaxID=180675 RepID=A0A8X8VZY4_SALSN|nr:hypothetical protein SASPL_154366 [Salvia splendens]